MCADLCGQPPQCHDQARKLHFGNAARQRFGVLVLVCCLRAYAMVSLCVFVARLRVSTCSNLCGRSQREERVCADLCGQPPQRPAQACEGYTSETQHGDLVACCLRMSFADLYRGVTCRCRFRCACKCLRTCIFGSICGAGAREQHEESICVLTCVGLCTAPCSQRQPQPHSCTPSILARTFPLTHLLTVWVYTTCADNADREL